jgi:Flp pilus assembly pilin Flp
MKSLFVRLVREDHGQDLIEYAMLATVIALVAYTGAQAAGTKLSDWYTNISKTVDKWGQDALK